MADRPLAGRTIAVTRPREQAAELAARLAELGAEVVVVPLIRIDPVEDSELVKGSVRDVHRYDWLVVTSANGVAALASWAGFPWLVRSVRIAAVGPATAEAFRGLGAEPAFVPERFAAEEIAAGLDPVSGRQVLVVQADIADTQLAEELTSRGATVTLLHVYRTVEVEAGEAELAALRAADAVVLMSGSAARSLAAQGGAGGARVVCIGPKTEAVARDVGLEVALVAREATSEGIIEALESHFAEAS